MGYNRPDLLANSLSLISGQNRRVYIHIDGPKSCEDYLAVCETFKTAEDFANKNLNVKIKFQDYNLGCKHAVPYAISWVFEKENTLIILEDDIVFTELFLSFMDWGLDNFLNDSKIWQINGWNPLPFSLQDKSIYISQFPQIWGWATWKDRWEKYDIDMSGYRRKNIRFLLRKFNGIFFKQQLRSKFLRMFEEIRDGFDNWDTQWLYAMLLNGGSSIGFGISLTGNIGFDERATHTKEGRQIYLSPPPNLSYLDWSKIERRSSSKLDSLLAYYSFQIYPNFRKFLIVKCSQLVVKFYIKVISRRPFFSTETSHE